MKILFLHGWTSVVGGRKPTFLKEHGHQVLNPPLPDEDIEESVRIAEAELAAHQPDVIVGSSRGGAVAMNMDSGDAPLVLLCPAWKNWGKATTVKQNTVILHSRQDDVIPFADSEELVANSNWSSESLIQVGTDHRLADPEPLQKMLECCVRMASEQSSAERPTSILDHSVVSGRYLFPRDQPVGNPFVVDVGNARLACFHRVIDEQKKTLVHFHGNGEVVANYIPFMADVFADMGLNSLFVEYRKYGSSSGKAQLVAMLGDGEAVLKAAGIDPEQAVVFGRSIGSLYAIELASRQPKIAGLIIESGIADPAERFLQNVDLSAVDFSEADIRAEVARHFDHQEKLARYTNPLLILHTENDGLIDIAHAERIHTWAASTQKQLIRFPQGDHNSIFRANMVDYLDVVKTFVQNLGA